MSTTMPGPKKIITAAILSVVILVVSFFYQDYPLGGTPAKSKLHQQALELYQAKSYKAAYMAIEDNFESLLDEIDGCELVLSILASNQKIGPTLAASKACMDKNKAVGLSEEAYAMAIASSGQFAEGAKTLANRVALHGNPRARAALAQLYVYDQKPSLAQSELLIAIDAADHWKPYLRRVFTARTFHEDPKFLEKLAVVISKKEKIHPSLEYQLLRKLRDYSLADAEGLII